MTTDPAFDLTRVFFYFPDPNSPEKKLPRFFSFSKTGAAPPPIVA